MSKKMSKVQDMITIYVQPVAKEKEIAQFGKN